jgi:signal transduction histidine kinase
MLRVVADDLSEPQTGSQQSEKSRGQSDAGQRLAPTAAQAHGAGRAESGFTIEQMVSEFRALRASVIRLWTVREQQASPSDLQDMIRFNEAVDQAIAESITTYTRDVRESKDRFLAILGHDLRTPIGAMVMSTKFMLDVGGLSETQLILMTRMEATARRMNRLVADLLEFTRTRFGDAIPIEAIDMDVAQMVQDVASEVRASYPASVIEVQSSGELKGCWDCERLTQALTNLVSNAVQHGAEGAPVEIDARGSQKEVVISVRNQGTPMTPEQIEHVFERMKAFGAPEGHDRRHLGLGLYIVDKIVRAHQGSIEVDSSAEKGTMFTICLPRERGRTTAG